MAFLRLHCPIRPTISQKQLKQKMAGPWMTFRYKIRWMDAFKILYSPRKRFKPSLKIVALYFWPIILQQHHKFDLFNTSISSCADAFSPPDLMDILTFMFCRNLSGSSILYCTSIGPFEHIIIIGCYLVGWKQVLALVVTIFPGIKPLCTQLSSTFLHSLFTKLPDSVDEFHFLMLY